MYGAFFDIMRPMEGRRIGFYALLVVSLLILAAGAAVHLFTGAVPLSDEFAHRVIFEMRLPRVLCGMLVGANLALAGAVFQAITQNEMASPYLLGVSQGAGLAILLTLVVFPSALALTPVFAMFGGLAAFFLTYAIAWRRGGAGPVRLILAGVILGAVAGSLQTALRLMMNDINQVQEAINWMTGSFLGCEWEQVKLILPWSVVSFAGMFMLSRHLDILLLGERGAQALGAKVNRLRFLLALLAVLASASAVAVAGMVGFVGLIVPHVVRSFTGPDHRRLLIGCLFAGPALTVAADALARSLLSPAQLPVGVLTGALGGAFFLVLLKTGRRRFSTGGPRHE